MRNARQIVDQLLEDEEDPREFLMSLPERQVHRGSLTLHKIPPDYQFPDEVTGDLWLGHLTTLPAGIVLPQTIGGGLFLGGLTALPAGIILPQTIGGSLYLQSLKALPAGIILPQNIGGDLWLQSLNQADLKRMRERYPNNEIIT